jgi:uncharacterized membrane protein
MTARQQNSERPPASPQQAREVAAHVTHSLEAVAALVAREEEHVHRHQRFIEYLTAMIGRPKTAYAIVAFVGAWVAWNSLGRAVGVPIVDPPPFSWLQGIVGVAALLTTTMVLATQNRLGGSAEQRARLDLQVNLIAEQKTAKIIALLEELRRDLPSVANRVDLEADAMTEAVDPHIVASALENNSVPPDSAPPSTDPVTP